MARALASPTFDLYLVCRPGSLAAARGPLYNVLTCTCISCDGRER